MGFMDLRQWVTLFEKDDGLRRIATPVDWGREIGTVARRGLEERR